MGMGKRCTPAAAAAPAPAGSGWARAGLGWGLWDGGALATRCGPVKVGDYGAHTQASWASKPGKHALGDLGELGSLREKLPRQQITYLGTYHAQPRMQLADSVVCGGTAHVEMHVARCC